MIRRITAVLFFLGIIGTATAQDRNVTISTDPVLDSLIEREISHNKTLGGIQGYRIQIYFGSERKGAQDARTRFLQAYPETEAYLIYQQPYFKVRVGDFRSRLEAQGIYKKLLHEFDRVFIVPDKINFPKI